MVKSKKINVKRMTVLVHKIKESEQEKKRLEDEIECYKDEIKRAMTANNLEELPVDVFTVRYKAILSSRFDSTAFKKQHQKMYEQYLTPTRSMKFTIT